MLDKAIEHGKEKREPYRNAKRFDTSCRNHGACPYCRENRLFKRKKAEVDSEMKIEEYLEDEESI